MRLREKWERFQVWALTKIGSGIDWDVRTDDSAITKQEQRQLRLQAASRQFRASMAQRQPWRPVWARGREEDGYQKPHQDGLRWPQELNGQGLFMASVTFTLRQQADRIEAAAAALWDELSTEVGTPLQGWAT